MRNSVRFSQHYHIIGRRCSSRENSKVTWCEVGELCEATAAIRFVVCTNAAAAPAAGAQRFVSRLDSSD